MKGKMQSRNDSKEISTIGGPAFLLGGGSYNPILGKALVNYMGIYSIGSTSPSSGELAVVVESNANPDAIHQRKVRIATDVHQNLASPSLVDLTHPSQIKRHLLHCVNPGEKRH